MKKFTNKIVLSIVALAMMSLTSLAQLSGTYTIDPNGTGTTNYASFTAATAALTTSGVSGAVTFNVKEGTYTEQVSFGAYTGASAANTITFKADAANTSAAIITFAPTSSATTSNYTVQFNNAAYITIDGLTVATAGTTYGRLVNMTGSTNNVINVDNCTFNGYVGSTSSFFALWYAISVSYDSLTIENSTFNDGSYALYVSGATASPSENFVFRNNAVNDFTYGYGVRASYCISGDVSNNTIRQSATATSFGYGVQLYGWSGNSNPDTWTVHDNDISLNYGYGIFAYYIYSPSTAPTTIYNNAIVFKNSGSSYNYGLYAYHPSNVEVTNNTFRTGSAYATNRAAYVLASSVSSYPTPSITLRNNIFHNEVQGYPVYFSIPSTVSNYITSENNLFSTPTSGLSGYYYGTSNLTSFAAYQAASGDSTSSEGDPQFTNAGDWHIEGLAASNNAQPVSYITTDLDGDARSSSTPDIGADEFVPPACATPSSLTFGAISATSASVSWMGASSAYELEWGLTGFTQGTGSTTSATTTSATLPGLFSSSTYDLYVRSNCVSSGNGYSGWYGPVSFTTPCLPYAVTSTTGFIENFDGSNWTANVSYQNDVFDNCWDRTPTAYSSFAFLVNSGGTPSSSTGPLAANSGSNYLYTESSFGSAGSPALVKLPTLDLSATTNPELSFYYHMYGATITGLWVDVSTDNGATFTAIDSLVGSQQTSQSASWTQHMTNLAAYAGDTIVIALRTQKGASFTGDLSIDNVSVQNVLCSGPSFLTSSGVNGSGATINWVVPDTANPTVVAWGPAGFTPGTGSTVTTYDSTYTLNTLASATCYDVYVQSMCGTNGSPWVGPVSFCTPCTAAAMPYTEDFQSWNSSLPTPLQCWDIDKGTNTALLYTDPTTSNNMVRYNYWSWSSGLTGIIESRPIAISSAATVSFDWSHSNQYYTSYNDALALRVRKSTSPNWDTLVYLNGQSFGSTGSAISTPGSFVTESVYLDTSYVGHDAIFEFYGASGWGPDVFIDNFAVGFIPTCPDPVLTSTGQTASSVTLAWSTVGTTALGSTITWGPQGFYSGTGATGTVVSAVTTPQTISGLTANTYYDFWVQDSCGGAGASAMVGPVTVKTSCLTTLSGVYTIDTAGTGANNFASLDSAVQFLGACGISGPVTFNVAAGSYTGSINLGQIVGGSSTNTVTFNGPSTGTATITAQLGSTSVVTLDGSEHVTISGLTLYSPVGSAVVLTGGAQYITLDNNVIIADTVATGLSAAITATNSLTSPTSYGLNAEHVTITNNHIKGGYYGIVINGSATTSKVNDYVINGNTLTKQYFYGIRTYYVENISIIGNSVTDNRATGGYGVMCYYTNDFTIEGNNLPAKSYGLYLYYPNAYDNSGLGYQPTMQSRVANNMVTGGSYGAYIYSPRFIDFHNNSFRGNTYGVYMSQTTAAGGEARDLDVRNNIFVGGSNYAWYTFGVVPPNMTLDYNVYNAGGANIAYSYGTIHTTLAAWQAADTAWNANSNDGPVNFMSNEDLHLITGANNIGAPMNIADSLIGPNLGGNGSAGNMFNVINTSGAPLNITGFSQGAGIGNTSVTGVTVQVYSTPGDYLTQSAASWTQAGTATANLTASAATGYCPVAVTIPAGATYGFYVGVATGSVQYTNGTGTPGVSTWFSNNDMIVTEGKGGPYPSPSFSPRNWNGTIHVDRAPVDIDGDTRSLTTPDIGADEYTPIQTDALNDKLIGGSGGCGDSTTMLYTVFQNFGLDTITSLPVELLITDASGAVTTLSATYAGSVLPMAYDTLLMGSLNTYAGGTYDFKSYTQLPNDGRANNDTIMLMGSSFLPNEPVVTGLVDTVCASQDSIILTAVNVPGTTYGWYASDTSSSVLAMGDSLTVSTSGQSSYFVGYLNTADTLPGPLPGGNGSAGNMFNIINTSGAPLSITGFSQGPGSGNSSVSNVTVTVYSTPGDYLTQSAASWTQAGTATANLTASAATGYCPVAVTIPAGSTYGFYVGTGSVQYTNGTGTPGVSTWFSNNDMIVTEGLGGAYPSPTFSPRCWNGTVHYGAAGCSNLRAEVEFAVNSDTALAVGTGVETDPLTGTFDFDATGSYGNSYTWYFGDSLGMMGSGMMTQHVYGAPGIYTVGLVVLDTICGTSDSTSFQVTCTVSMDENGLDQAVRAFPNPSNGQLAIQINGATSFEGSLEIINGVGKVLVNESVSKQEGRFELPLDLSNLPKGVYTLRLSGDNGQTNLRIVLQ